MAPNRIRLVSPNPATGHHVLRPPQAGSNRVRSGCRRKARLIGTCTNLRFWDPEKATKHHHLAVMPSMQSYHSG
jgi:hypothetical protein